MAEVETKPCVTSPDGNLDGTPVAVSMTLIHVVDCMRSASAYLRASRRSVPLHAEIADRGGGRTRPESCPSV